MTTRTQPRRPAAGKVGPELVILPTTGLQPMLAVVQQADPLPIIQI